MVVEPHASAADAVKEIGACGGVIEAGALQATTGGVLSTTVTVALQLSDSPCESVTMRVTGVVPSGYGPGGFWLTVSASPSGSDDPPSIEAGAVQAPASALTVTEWQTATGGRLVE